MFASMHQEQSPANAVMPAAGEDAWLDSGSAWRVLDEIDWVAARTSEGDLLHANHVARDELSQSRFLREKHGGSHTAF
jgi:hypothetical protein